MTRKNKGNYRVVVQLIDQEDEPPQFVPVLPSEDRDVFQEHRIKYFTHGHIIRCTNIPPAQLIKGEPGRT